MTADNKPAPATSPGGRFRAELARARPLPIVGTINAYTALMARRIGHRAIYLSGGGVANASFGLPDLGITNLADVVEDAGRITAACDTPLLVDIDTGFGGAFGIARTIKSLIRAEVAAVHIEDQVAEKRCGHRPGKVLVPAAEMVDRIRAAVDARTDDAFFIMARTDAFAGEGRDAAIERALAYVEAGADGIFLEAISREDDYRAFRAALGDVPILANMTEFGRTELHDQQTLADWGVDMALYPLSAFRAMNRAAENVYRHILADGHQRAVVDTMQTREELYDYLDYHAWERKLDELFADPDQEDNPS